MRKVAVFFGGKSCEREISILTGVFVINMLDKERYTVLPVYIEDNGNMYTSPKMFSLDFFRKNDRRGIKQIFFDGRTMYELSVKKGKIRPIDCVDVALNCCHGGLGEGGGISALAAANNIPLASPDMLASSVFMDKGATKVVLRGLHIPTLEFIRVNEEDYKKRSAFLLKRIASLLKYPVIIKPARLGSSIGIAVAKNEGEVKQAIEQAFLLDDKLIIERYLEDKIDVNCAAYTLHGEIVVSEVERAFGGGVYSFEEKYIKRNKEGSFLKNEGGRYALNEELRAKIRSYTKTVYKRMNLRGVVRMDYLVSKGEVYLCEVNTVPGSLAYYLFCERLIDAKAFFGDLLEEGLSQAKVDEKQIVHTGILQTISYPNK